MNKIFFLVQSLLMEKDSNRDLGDVIGTQNENLKNLQGTLTKRTSQLEETTLELEKLTKELAQKGVVIDPELLKEAL